MRLGPLGYHDTRLCYHSLGDSALACTRAHDTWTRGTAPLHDSTPISPCGTFKHNESPAMRDSLSGAGEEDLVGLDDGAGLPLDVVTVERCFRPVQQSGAEPVGILTEVDLHPVKQ